MEENKNKAENDQASEVEMHYSQEGIEERSGVAQEVSDPLGLDNPVTNERLISPAQYSPSASPDVTHQQGQQYGGVTEDIGDTSIVPEAGRQSYYYVQPLTGGNPNQQYEQQGQAYQSAPEYKDHSVFYQNQSGQQQGQYSDQYNQQQYGQTEQNHEGLQQESYQQSQEYLKPQPRQRSSQMAIASLAMGFVASVGALLSFGLMTPLEADELIMVFIFIVANVGLILGLISIKKNRNEKALMGIILNEFFMLLVASMMAYIINYFSS